MNIEKITKLVKFTDSELKSLVRLADAVNEKQEYRLELNKAREYVKGMKDIADKIQELRSKYGQFQREFNKIRLLMLPSKVDENTIKEFKALVTEKQKYDARS